MLLDLFRRISTRQILFAGCLLTLLYALFSQGVYHSDEHYQILEYAHMKLFGTPTVEHLAWEYPLQMRSGVQPFVAWCVGRGLLAAGIWSPWLTVRILQLLSGLLSVVVLCFFYRTVCRELDAENRRKWFLLTGLCLWFMAYLHVHFNAEMLAGNLLMLLAALTIRCQRPECRPGDPREFLRGGMLGVVAGALFVVRYQAGFALLGFGIWLLVFRRSWRLYAGLAAGVAVMLMVGLAADRWLYGEWTCSPWNYLCENILHARMDQFRHEPWWYYLTAPILDGGIFFGLLLLVATIVFFWRHPRHVVTWMLIPFLLVHFFLAHKEIRFFFPAVFFAPWFLVELFRGRGERFTRRGWQWAFGVLAVMNLGAVVYNLTQTTPDISFYKVMCDYCRGKGEVVALNLAHETTYYSRLQNFSGEPRVTEARFYMPANLDNRHCATPEELAATARRLTAEGVQVVVLSEDPDLGKSGSLPLRKVVWSPYPAWVMRYFNFNDWTRFAVRSKNIYEWETSAGSDAAAAPTGTVVSSENVVPAGSAGSGEAASKSSVSGAGAAE